MRKKKVMITGANGFIGKEVVHELSGRGFEVVPLVRTKAGLNGEIAIDFCDRGFYDLIYSLPKVDAVVHLGAKIGWSGAGKSELLLPNVITSAVLANWAHSHGAYFIFASAAIVCGVRNPAISLASIPNPDTDYGYSKFIAEEVIKMSGVRAAILRIAGVFGLNGPEHLGLNRAITGALNGKVPVIKGTGQIKRNYIYVKDLSRLIVMCLEKEIEGTHFVAGQIYSIEEMMMVICRIILPGQKPEYHEGEVGQDQIVETSLISNEEHAFENAIRDIVTDAKRSQL
jgi:nucleoside-diphosphate-sugar epimerase